VSAVTKRFRVRDAALRRAVLAAVGAGLLICSPVAADEPEGEVTVLAQSHGPDDGWATGGSKTCMKCHDETEERPVLSIFATPHGVLGDEGTPMAQAHTCQTCHGPSAAHVADPGAGTDRAPVAVVFGPDQPVGPQNEACLACHSGGDRMNWSGSPHESSDVPCAACHTVHAKEDPVLTMNVRAESVLRGGQAATCFQCHPQQRAQTHRYSSHPLREGLIRCSDCHNPHGSMTEHLLTKPTLNETCYQCHAEKRGPFLWEHPPVREDCTNCHLPHGSNHPTLLKQQQPQLCQQCHMATYHPSTAYTPPDIAGGNADFHMLDKGCLNCHSQIHGSNHPSGVRWTR
jgi:DmsE family decaheme c-type cytochrome